MIFLFALFFATQSHASLQDGPPKDIPKLCEDSAYQSVQSGIASRAGEEPRGARIVAIARTGSAKTIRSALLSTAEEQEDMPWILAHAPRYEARRAAYQLQMEFAARELGASGLDQLFRRLEEAARRPVKMPYSERSLEIARKFRTEWAKWPGVQTDYPLTRWREILLPALCVRFVSLSCMKNMATFLRVLDPRRTPGNNHVMNPGLIERFLDQPEYLPGAARAALRIHARILQADHSRKQRGYILEDLTESYLETGLSKPEASRRAWDLLGFYGSRGASIANVIQHLSHSENLPLYAAMMLIFSGIEALNAASPPTAPYGYPPGMQTTCAYGKAYHFWMSAYLSHSLSVTQGVEGSTRASYIWGTLYEMFSESGSRWAFRVLLEPLYSESMNGIRLNLAFNGLGASYGGNKKMIANGNADAVIMRLLDSARPIAPMKASEAQEIVRKQPIKYGMLWERLFAPHSIF